MQYWLLACLTFTAFMFVATAFGSVSRSVDPLRDT